MELRRALLLFAVVLGLAAIASSLSRPAEEERRDEPRPAERTTPGSAATGAERRAAGRDVPREGDDAAASDSDDEAIRFEVGGRAPERRLEPGAAATVLVSVKEPSQVRIEGLGLIQAANPLTPARFEVLAERETTSEVVVTPANGGPSEAVGTLIVGDPR